jgi:hypothetical protein
VKSKHGCEENIFSVKEYVLIITDGSDMESAFPRFLSKEKP